MEGGASPRFRLYTRWKIENHARIERIGTAPDSPLRGLSTRPKSQRLGIKSLWEFRGPKWFLDAYHRSGFLPLDVMGRGVIDNGRI